MTNLDFITPRIATGGSLVEDEGDAVAQLFAWRELGITHIVDNRLEWSDETLVSSAVPDITYLHIGVDDDGQRKPDVWFDAGAAFVREALARQDTKVHVHCYMGINRGPSMAYALLLDEGWDPIEAIATIRQARPIAGMGYAEDALDWHHRRTSAPEPQRGEERRRLAEWREANAVDFERLLRPSPAAGT